MGVERKLALVTGASQGIGRATVLSLCLQHGVDVIAIARNKEALSSLAAECEGATGRLIPLAVDLWAEGTVQMIKSTVGGARIHALVHNAGSLLVRKMGEHERSDLESVFGVNVLGPLLLTQALVDELSGEPPGHVVHISSMGGFQDSAKFPGLVAYSASKAALACVSQCLAEEFKDKGIRSNCLALGAVDTPMLREAFPGYAAPVSAEDMGAYVADFALNGHKLFNGKVLPVAVGTP